MASERDPIAWLHEVLESATPETLARWRSDARAIVALRNVAHALLAVAEAARRPAWSEMHRRYCCRLCDGLSVGGVIEHRARCPLPALGAAMSAEMERQG